MIPSWIDSGCEDEFALAASEGNKTSGDLDRDLDRESERSSFGLDLGGDWDEVRSMRSTIAGLLLLVLIEISITSLESEDWPLFFGKLLSTVFGIFGV